MINACSISSKKETKLNYIWYCTVTIGKASKFVLIIATALNAFMAEDKIGWEDIIVTIYHCYQMTNVVTNQLPHYRSHSFLIDIHHIIYDCFIG